MGDNDFIILNVDLGNYKITLNITSHNTEKQGFMNRISTISTQIN